MSRLRRIPRSTTGLLGLDFTGLIFGAQDIKADQDAADSLARHHGVVVFEYNPYRFGPKGEAFDSLVDLHIRGPFPKEFETEVGRVILTIYDESKDVRFRLGDLEDQLISENIAAINQAKDGISDTPLHLSQKMIEVIEQVDIELDGAVLT